MECPKCKKEMEHFECLTPFKGKMTIQVKDQCSCGYKEIAMMNGDANHGRIR